MKNYFLNLIVLLGLCTFAKVVPVHSQISVSTNFQLPENAQKIKPFNSLPITSQTRIPLDVNEPVTSLGISGTVDMEGEDSYVRITIADNSNREFVVYETFPLMSGSYHEDLESIAMESIDLYDIIPQSLCVNVYKSSVRISEISVTYDKSLHDITKTKFSNQEKEIISALNQNIKDKRLLWKAGETSVSSLSYEGKKALMGDSIPFLYGLEYYRGGVYSLALPSAEYNLINDFNDIDTCFVQSYDWRNRHGKNWITSIKEQQGSTCWAFATTAAVEARANIAYNQILDYDLSEQNLVSCLDNDSQTVSQRYNRGGYSWAALDYIGRNGIVTEECFPFQGVVSCDEKCDGVTECVRSLSFRNLYFKNKSDITTYELNRLLSIELKKAIIKSPVVVDYFRSLGHSMCCVGFYRLSVPDTVVLHVNTNYSAEVDSTSMYFNDWVWILKNSWGEDWGENGYCRAIFTSAVYLRLYELTGGIYSSALAEKDRLVTDEDGDGCFVWGGGFRPSCLPSYAENLEDGDDSNSIIGEMDEYGKCHSNSLLEQQRLLWDVSTLSVIDRNSIIKIPEVIVSNGGTLRIEGVYVEMKDDTNITVQNGGKLVIDAGELRNVSVHVESGGQLSIMNNGQIVLYSGGTLNYENGSIIDIESTVEEQSRISGELQAEVSSNSTLSSIKGAIISCSPNPTYSIVTVESQLASDVKAASIVIRNLEGVEEKRVNLSVNYPTVTLDLSSLKKGMHIVNLIVDGRVSDSARLIKE